MTPKQCHANHYHSQQVEGSIGWDKHSSGDLRNRQMDGQDEENRRIYNQGDFTKNRRTIRKTLGSSIGGVSGEEKKKSFSAEDRGRALTFPPDDPVTQRSHPIVEGVLTKAQFSNPLFYQIHYIGPVGFRFGFAHIYSERSPPKRYSTVFYYQIKILIGF